MIQLFIQVIVIRKCHIWDLESIRLRKTLAVTGHSSEKGNVNTRPDGAAEALKFLTLCMIECEKFECFTLRRCVRSTIELTRWQKRDMFGTLVDKLL